MATRARMWPSMVDSRVEAACAAELATEGGARGLAPADQTRVLLGTSFVMGGLWNRGRGQSVSQGLARLTRLCAAPQKVAVRAGRHTAWAQGQTRVLAGASPLPDTHVKLWVCSAPSKGPAVVQHPDAGPQSQCDMQSPDIRLSLAPTAHLHRVTLQQAGVLAGGWALETAWPAVAGCRTCRAGVARSGRDSGSCPPRMSLRPSLRPSLSPGCSWALAPAIPQHISV